MDKKTRLRYADKLVQPSYYGSVSVSELKGGEPPGEASGAGYIWAPYIPVTYALLGRPWHKLLLHRLYRWYLRKTGQAIRVGGSPEKDEQGNTLY